MYSKEFLENLYRIMLKIRFCEESLIEPIFKGEVQCPVHLYTGQEAIAVGICAALKKRDYIFGAHRSHGHYIAKAGDIKELIAEIYGKVAGCSKGRGGSMHLYAPDYGFLGSSPIVAGTISLAVGAALASKIKMDKRVTVSFFGDGATGEGVLYESLNFAALKKLPLIFVCENNFYSTHLPINECRPDNNIFKIAEPFNITSSRIDGNNVLAVYTAAEHAVQLCKDNKGPVFIECITYRMRGHVGPDDNIQGTHTDIRPDKEIEEWKKKSPINNFELYLLKNKFLKKDDFTRIKQEIEKEVAEAYLFMKESPYPKESELTDYVFKN